MNRDFQTRFAALLLILLIPGAVGIALTGFFFGTASLVLVAVSLDPYAPQEAILHLPLQRLGIPEDETCQVHDALSGERALWQGPTALVRLTPERPAAIWSVLRFRKTEEGFDYYF